MWLALASATTASAAPFPTRDQNPFVAVFGLPQPLPAKVDSSDAWRLESTLNWTSSAVAQASDREALIADVEIRELRLMAARPVADRFEIRMQVPYRYTGAGTLDGFIDNWHEFFGLPEGARRSLQPDRYRLAYQRNGTVQFDQRSSATGVGDISLDVGRQLFTSEASTAAAWFSLKLPTGNTDDFMGSGAVDASLSTAGEHRFAGRWTVFGQAAATWLGHGDILPAQQRSSIFSALAGINVTFWRGLDLKLQLDGHTDAFDSELDFLGDALILTVGGAYRFRSGWQLDIGVSEDIAVDASPDVVFVLGIRRGSE